MNLSTFGPTTKKNFNGQTMFVRNEIETDAVCSDCLGSCLISTIVFICVKLQMRWAFLMSSYCKNNDWCVQTGFSGKPIMLTLNSHYWLNKLLFGC